MYSITRPEPGCTAIFGLPTQLLWVRQPRPRRYRAAAKSAARRADQQQLPLASLEQNRDYQRLVARLLRLSKRLQGALSAEQRRTWLTLEDALSDHAWFLHAYYFKAGYDLGKTTKLRPSYDHSPVNEVDELREHVVLLSALAKLLDRLVDIAR